MNYKIEEFTSFLSSYGTNLFLFHSENLKTFIPEFILLLVYIKSDLGKTYPQRDKLLSVENN